MLDVKESIDDEPLFVDLSQVLESNDNYALSAHFNRIDKQNEILIVLRISAI